MVKYTTIVLLAFSLCVILGCTTMDTRVGNDNMTKISAHRPDVITGKVNYTDPNVQIKKPKKAYGMLILRRKSINK